MNGIMNYTKLMHPFLLSLAIFLCGMFVTSCDQDIELSAVDESVYESVKDNYAYLKNIDSPHRNRVVEIREDQATVQILFAMTRAVNQAIDVTLKIDEKTLKQYNQEHGTDFELIPTELVSIEENGMLLIAPGDTESYPIDITVKKSELLEEGKIYALPISIDSISDGVKLASENKSYIYLVKLLDGIPSTDKGTGIITICYVEINNNNPLNAGEWSLRTSGKPLVDIVNLFAANINYNEETGRMYVNINPNLQHILDNREKYIKPLQDKGIKVCLSILGNHDGTGVANMSDQVARDFAMEIKAIVDAYGLDGVDFDDEWSDYDKYPTRPGFVERGPQPYARLCYETKKVMPDKLCTVYFIGAVVPNSEANAFGFDQPIDGIFPGDFVDYSYNAYYGTINYGYNSIKGMRKSQWGPTSIDVQDGSNAPNMKLMRREGFGVQVIYDLRAADQDYYTLSRYTKTFSDMAKILFDDAGIVFSGTNHRVDW